MDTQDFFAPLLPWQQTAWQQITQQYRNQHLPHGLLAAGMAGIGKRPFVWRLVAWLLCHQPSDEGACGVCDSCVWLQAKTHPNFRHLPQASDDVIKIDEIRALQDFFATKSMGVRVVVFDGAETMTVGAANALLKTLEEPNGGVYLILITDYASKLLPTIKSRVQCLPLHQINHQQAYGYVDDYLKSNQHTIKADTLLTLSDFAPLMAIRLPSLAWYDKRVLWLKTYVALQLGTRQVVQASDYWQSILSFEDFLVLSRLMLLELWRLGLGMAGLHDDIKSKQLVAKLVETRRIDGDKLNNLLFYLDDVAQATAQNVQEKQAYDALMYQLAS